MLLGFSFNNIYSYRNKTTLSFMASKIKEFQEENSHKVRDFSLLKSMVIYGKNSSGKSNILRALTFMKNFILLSNTFDSSTNINVQHFKLNSSSQKQPSCFELSFIIEDKIYIYGFKILNNEIQEEWLEENVKRFKTLFHRSSPDSKSIEIGNSFKEGKYINKDLVRRNALFLPLVASYNGEISNQILEWLKKELTIISADTINDNSTIELSKDPIFKKQIVDFLKVADLDIHDFKVEEEDIPEHVKKVFDNDQIFNKELIKKLGELTALNIKTVHKKYNDSGEIDGEIEVSKNSFESEGTNKFFSLSGPIIKTLNSGGTIIIDELDSKLHPLMVKYILEKFNSFENSSSQILINTHNTTLLNITNLRRDQIWFVDKNRFGESELYSLSDYKNDKSVRKDESYEKNYLLGKYGAIPKFHEYNSYNEE